MKREPSPSDVAERLERLRTLYVAETEDEGRRRHVAVPRPERPFAEAVASRLTELRALLDLTAHLRGGRPRE